MCHKKGYSRRIKITISKDVSLLRKENKVYYFLARRQMVINDKDGI